MDFPFKGVYSIKGYCPNNGEANENSMETERETGRMGYCGWFIGACRRCKSGAGAEVFAILCFYKPVVGVSPLEGWVSKIGTPVVVHFSYILGFLLKETRGKKGTCIIKGLLENLVTELCSGVGYSGHWRNSQAGLFRPPERV